MQGDPGQSQLLLRCTAHLPHPLLPHSPPLFYGVHSAQSVGSGEFLDLIPLVDLCAATGFSLIQVGSQPLPCCAALWGSMVCRAALRSGAPCSPCEVKPSCSAASLGGGPELAQQMQGCCVTGSAQPCSVPHTCRPALQVLPVSDTSVRGAVPHWRDSYPYSSLCVFALHPLYLRLQALAGGAGRWGGQGAEPEA